MLTCKSPSKVGRDELGLCRPFIDCLKKMSELATMNEVYARFFVHRPPARTTVEVTRLPKDVLIEIEATAIG